MLSHNINDDFAKKIKQVLTKSSRYILIICNYALI